MLWVVLVGDRPVCRLSRRAPGRRPPPRRAGAAPRPAARPVVDPARRRRRRPPARRRAAARRRSPAASAARYGDAAQNAGGLVLDATALAGHHVDRPRARHRHRAARARASTSSCAWLVPRGWFVPVTPGTRFVTVGGAIAADIHGKGHHVDGTFGNHVARRSRCAPAERRGAHGHARRRPRSSSGPPPAAWASPASSSTRRSSCIPVETSLHPRRRGALRRPRRAAWRCMAESDDRVPLLGGVDRLHSPAARRLGRGILGRGDHAPLDDAAEASAARRRCAFAPKRCSRGAAGLPDRARQPLQRRARSTSSGSARRREPHAARRSRSRPFFHPLDMRRRLEPDLRQPRASCSTSSSCRSAREAVAAPRRSSMLSDARTAVVPRGAQALRRREPRDAVVPDAGLDARASTSRSARPSCRAARPPRRARRSRPAAACTWPRTPATRPEHLAADVPPPRRVARSARQLDPDGVVTHVATWPAASASTTRAGGTARR